MSHTSEWVEKETKKMSGVRIFFWMVISPLNRSPQRRMLAAFQLILTATICAMMLPLILGSVTRFFFATTIIYLFICAIGAHVLTTYR